MTPERPVAERAIFTAFSTASTPVVKKAVFFRPSMAETWVRSRSEMASWASA